MTSENDNLNSASGNSTIRSVSYWESTVVPRTAMSHSNTTRLVSESYQRLIPKESYTALFNMLHENSPSKDTVERLISELGEDIINGEDSSAKSFTLELVCHGHFQWAQLIADYAAERSIPLRFTWRDTDILGWAIDRQSPDCIQFVLDALCAKRVQLEETAKILTTHYDRLLKYFPQMAEYIENDALCFEYGQFQVPHDFLIKQNGQVIGMITDHLPNWEAKDDAEAKAYWIRHRPEFIFIRNNQHLRRGKIVASLTNAHVSDRVFKSKAIGAFVQWMWQTYCRRSCLFCLVVQLIAAASLSTVIVTMNSPVSGLSKTFVYLFFSATVFVGLSGLISLRRTALPFLLMAGWAFGGLLFPSIAEAINVIGVSLLTIYPWFSVLHFLQPLNSTGPLVSLLRSAFRDVTPLMFLATAVILAFSSALTYLHKTHVEIHRKEKDMAEEEYIAFTSFPRTAQTLFLALVGEFDTVNFNPLRIDSTDQADQSSDEFNEPQWSDIKAMRVWIVIVFDIFLLFAVIVLQTVLISVVGDSYDRMKLNEDAVQLKCRARIVATWNRIWVGKERFARPREISSRLGESFRWNALGVGKKCSESFNWKSMEESKQRSWLSRFPLMNGPFPSGMYFHFLVAKDPLTEQSDTTWRGKILEMVDLNREDLRKSEERWLASLNELRKENADRLSMQEQRLDNIENLLQQLLSKL